MSLVFSSFAIAFPILLSGASGMGAATFCLSRQRRYLRGNGSANDALMGNAVMASLIILLAGSSAFWVGKQLGEIPQSLIAQEQLT